MTPVAYRQQGIFLEVLKQKTISEYLVSSVKQFENTSIEIPSDLGLFMLETLLSLKNDLNAIGFGTSPVEIKPAYKNPVALENNATQYVLFVNSYSKFYRFGVKNVNLSIPLQQLAH
ncbi:hypothetical protein [Rasiella sp. SM2506]|uniref:hypothetical protein n=1 Tax=Rasiella sp. SM2506 TaxID=3423914 RepID=UPI003D7A9F21